MPQPSKCANAEQRDEQLAALLAELTEKAAQGERVDIHQHANQHPELADELIELWGAVMLADAIGSDASRQALKTSPPQPRSSDARAALELPCQWGDYELLAEIGRGGMGIVYEAQQI